MGKGHARQRQAQRERQQVGMHGRTRRNWRQSASWRPGLPVAGGLEREVGAQRMAGSAGRSEEHTSELQSLMRSSYDVFGLKKNTDTDTQAKQPTAIPQTNVS